MIFDATRLAHLNGLVRIASGRDAADTAVASVFGSVSCTRMKVSCALGDGQTSRHSRGANSSAAAFRFPRGDAHVLRLNVHHRTTYSYSEPVTFGRHRLVLRPREGHDLRIVEMALEIEPAHEITWVRDVYGNSLALVDFTAPAKRLEIVSDVTVERVEPFPERRFHEPWLVPWPVEYVVEEQVVIDAYRRLSFPDDAGALEQWLGADPVRRTGTPRAHW